jgi:hypothetical protein
VAAPRRKLPADLVWVSLDQLDVVTLSGPHRRWVTEILRTQEAVPAARRHRDNQRRARIDAA